MDNVTFHDTVIQRFPLILTEESKAHYFEFRNSRFINIISEVKLINAAGFESMLWISINI